MIACQEVPNPSKRSDMCTALLVKREGGKWLVLVLPTERGYKIAGGMREEGETPEAATLREIREELGVELLNLKHLVSVQDQRDRSHMKHFSWATEWKGEIRKTQKPDGESTLTIPEWVELTKKLHSQLPFSHRLGIEALIKGLAPKDEEMGWLARGLRLV